MFKQILFTLFFLLTVTAVTFAQSKSNDAISKQIKDANADVVDYERDLKKAQNKGDAKKASKYQSKIEQKKIEIKSFEKDLSDLN